MNILGNKKIRIGAKIRVSRVIRNKHIFILGLADTFSSISSYVYIHVIG